MIDVLTTRTAQRGFLHKRIAKFAGRVVRTGLNVAGAAGIPGFSQGARLARSFLRGGSRDPSFREARGRALGRGRGGTQFALPAGLRPKGPGGIIGLLPGVPGGVSGFAGAEATASCPKGFHINRSGYHLKSGEFVAPMSRCVRNRRRNNDNGSAAMRAARRLLGRKKSQDRIDQALRAFAPSRRRTTSKKAGLAGTTVIQN